jgi:NitT/TauT family transport system ATP-binding protein
MKGTDMATLATRLPAWRPLVQVEHVSHRYGKGDSGAAVLDDVSLTLHEDEVVGLLGRSGSGKSTLLRSIAGLIRPNEGIVRFAHVEDGPAHTISMVFQTFALFPWLGSGPIHVSVAI